MKKCQFILFIYVMVITITCNVTNYAYAEVMSAEHCETQEKCLNCHGKNSLSITKDSAQVSLYVEVYKLQASVHGAFECKSCHMISQDHAYGRVLTERISQKCASCHTGAAFEYGRSVHNNKGKKEAPNCVDCHGGHYIKPLKDEATVFSGTNIAATCARQCHQVQFEQFKESFHGKAVALNSKNAPSCVTCHGSHRILSKTNVVALSNAKKKPLLCAKCHDGEALGVGTVEHYETKPEGYGKPMYYVKTKMPWLIIFVMGVFLVHIILDLIHRIRARISEVS